MEKFAEQVTQQLAKDIETAVNYKLAAASPLRNGLGLGALYGTGGALSGLINGGLLGTGIGAITNLGNEDQSWDSYRNAMLTGAKWGGGLGAGLGGVSGALLGGIGGYKASKAFGDLASSIEGAQKDELIRRAFGNR
jgi:hypothetical protein